MARDVQVFCAAGFALEAAPSVPIVQKAEIPSVHCLPTLAPTRGRFGPLTRVRYARWLPRPFIRFGPFELDMRSASYTKVLPVSEFPTSRLRF